MKRALLFAAALCVGLAALAKPGILTKNYPVNHFDAIDASGIYRIDLSKDARCGVTIQAPDFMEPYLNVKVVDGTLHLGMDKLPLNIQRNLNKSSEKIWATVTMPSVRRISLSGAVKLAAYQPFVEPEEFRLQMSGASQADGLAIEAPKAKLEISGAGRCQLPSAVFGDLTLRVSGAGKTDFMDLQAENVDAEYSGAAKVTMKGRIGMMDLETSGAVKAEIKGEGTAARFRVRASGASRVDAEDFPAETILVDLSGSSLCRAHAIVSLRVETSGASTCQYRCKGDTDVRVLSAGRGSSVSKL